MNYYNENDRQAAAWLRELITAGGISEGIVDERSIVEVTPLDLKGFAQCHFFAGIGGWSYALRLAGWSDERPVWTASLPCQPWSDAGKRQGEDDSRHLWPTFRELVDKCSPPVLFGEQVASALGRLWLARVRADLEDLGNEVGAADLCAAGVRAPHRRQRLFWVAYASGDRRDLKRRESGESKEARESGQQHQSDASSEVRRLADADRDGRRTARRGGSRRQKRHAEHGGGDGRVGDTEGQGRAGSEHARASGQEESDGAWVLGAGGSGSACRLGDAMRAGSSPFQRQAVGRTRRRKEGRATGKSSRASDRLADAAGTPGPEHEREPRQGSRRATSAPDRADRGGVGSWMDDPSGERAGDQATEPSRDQPQDRLSRRPSPWDDYDLIPCRDGKARRVESGTFPLAHGLPGRVGLLRGYGNAIVPILAAEFIKASEEARAQ